MTRENVTPVVRELLDSMVRMLITFEMELTAYHLVLGKAQERIIQAGIPWDMQSNVRTMLKTPALEAEAEAEYAPFAALLQQITVENLEAALACMKRRIDRQNETSNPPEELPL